MSIETYKNNLKTIFHSDNPKHQKNINKSIVWAKRFSEKNKAKHKALEKVKTKVTKIKNAMGKAERHEYKNKQGGITTQFKNIKFNKDYKFRDD